MKLTALVGYDSDHLPVYFELEITNSEYKDSKRLSIDTLLPIGEYKKVSLTGYAWDAVCHDWAYGGQIDSSVDIETYSMPKEDVQYMLDVGIPPMMNIVNVATISGILLDNGHTA